VATFSSGRRGDNVHTVPAATHQHHQTRSSDTTCWCLPAHYRICPECGGDERGCWKCTDGVGPNGLLRITPTEAAVIGEALVIAHNDRPMPLT
jgi:hypothetical protein